MRTFLSLPYNDEDHKNIRINLDHVIEYKYNETESTIVFTMINGTENCLTLHNINPKKIIKRIDSLSKPLKLQILKTDVK